MFVLILGLIIFLGTHSARIFASDLRSQLIGKLGENGWKAAYSILSLIGFVLIIWGYGQARFAGPPVLYQPPTWMGHIALLLMLFAFIAFAATYFGGRIRSMLKHPQLVAVKIWALAHLLANGDLASVILFVSFLAWAVLDRISIKKRGGVNSTPVVVDGIPGDIIAVVGGIGLYLAFVFWLHGALIGVYLLPS